MKIAAAQLNSILGNIQTNLNTHYKLIEQAIKNNVQLITFPEMSLTGYCRKDAHLYSFKPVDTRLNKLQNLSNSGNIILIVGAPILIESRLHIGSFIIKPNEPIQIYTKQFLHGDEALFFSPSSLYNPAITLENELIHLAICADIANSTHPKQASEQRCTLYLPSIFYSVNGIKSGHEQLQHYAKKYGFSVLMSNYTGQLWNVESGGTSAFWNSDGKRIGQLKTDESGILCIEKIGLSWRVQIID